MEEISRQPSIQALHEYCWLLLAGFTVRTQSNKRNIWEKKTCSLARKEKKKQQFKITTNSADKAIGKEINTIRKNQSILN
jgi:hypothetical protein